MYVLIWNINGNLVTFPMDLYLWLNKYILNIYCWGRRSLFVNIFVLFSRTYAHPPFDGDIHLLLGKLCMIERLFMLQGQLNGFYCIECL